MRSQKISQKNFQEYFQPFFPSYLSSFVELVYCLRGFIHLKWIESCISWEKSIATEFPSNNQLLADCCLEALSRKSQAEIIKFKYGNKQCLESGVGFQRGCCCFHAGFLCIFCGLNGGTQWKLKTNSFFACQLSKGAKKLYLWYIFFPLALLPQIISLTLLI